MRMALTMLVIGLMACGFSTYAGAQDGVKFGMGIELQNQPTMIMEDFNLSGGAAYLTPSILFTIQVTPKVFIEPSIGYHRFGDKEVESFSTTPPYSQTTQWTGSALEFGVGMIYALKPDAAVSPMLHPMLGIIMVKATNDVTSTATPPANSKWEGSATAFQVGLGVGGLVNLKETVYLTIEARLMLTSVGDVAEKRPNVPGYKDTSDTSQSMFDTDMVIGLRFVF